MKKVIKLTETQLKKVIENIVVEQEKKDTIDDLTRRTKNIPVQPVKYLSQRDLDNKFGQTRGPGREIRAAQIIPSLTLFGNLFANGIDKIDTASNDFKNGVDAIKEAIKKGSKTIIVTGGASRVGEENKYDNEALARRRAQNFIAKVRDMFPNVTFQVQTKIGEETKKNSPAAKAEQFVRLTFPGSITTQKRYNATNSTQLAMKNTKQPKPVEQKKVKEKIYYKVCYWVPAEYYESVVDLINKTGPLPCDNANYS